MACCLKFWEIIFRKSGYFPAVNVDTMDQLTDLQNVGWINQMINQIWPFLSSMLSDVLKNDVTTELQKELPSLLKSLYFKEVNLGSKPLQVNGVKVYTEHVRPNEILIDLSFEYLGDATIKVALKSGITAGLTDIMVKGAFRVVINPLLKELPLVGAIQIYFLETPEFGFDLTNLLNILDFPGLSDIFRNCVGKVIERFIVLPNRVTIPISDQKYLTALNYPLPLGVIQVHVLEAKDLIASDTALFTKSTSDPYVETTVGMKKYKVKTKVIDNSLNPVWKDARYAEFVNTVVGFNVRFQVFDDDTFNDDKLGYSQIDMLKIVEEGKIDTWLKLENVKSGLLHVKCFWYTFSSDPRDIKKKPNDDERIETSCLFVKIHKATNLPASNKEEGTSSPFLQITVGEVTNRTKTIKDTKLPEWGCAFSFFVRNVESDQMNIKIYNGENEEVMGTLDYSIKDLLTEEEMTTNDKALKIENCTTDAQLFVSLQLKAIVTSSDEQGKSDSKTKK